MKNVDDALACLDEIEREKEDLYSAGELTNRIFIDNCLTVMANIADKSIDLCITDPPWGVDYKAFREKFKGQEIFNDKLSEYRKLMEDFPYELRRVLKNDAGVYLFCGATTPVTTDGKEIHWGPYDVLKRFFRAGFKPRRMIVWDKTSPGRGYRYRFRLEFILYFTKREQSVFYGDGEFRDELILLNEEAEMIRYQKVHGGNKKHPAEKPIRLYESFIKDSTRIGELVIDPFAGSGPLIEACKNTSRNFLVVEQNEKYRKDLDDRGRQVTIFEHMNEPIQLSVDDKKEEQDDDPFSDINSYEEEEEENDDEQFDDDALDF
jgi:DNA modification methylase